MSIENFSDTLPLGLYEDAIGETNVNYYADKFEDFDQRALGLHASWNWAAFFGGGAWALYRKMYVWFAAWWFVATVVTVFAKSPDVQVHRVLTVAVGVLWLGFSIFANSLYHRKVRTRIAAARNSNADSSRVTRRLRADGGVLLWVPIGLGGILVVGIAAAVALPAYQDYTKRQGVAARQTGSANSPVAAQASRTADKMPWEEEYQENGGEIQQSSAKPASAKRPWSGNEFDRFDTAGSIELRARQFPSLNEVRPWAAVIAWQANYMALGKKPANEALYAAVGTVLEGFNDNKGVCRPGRVVIVDAASADDAFPVGAALTLFECDR